MKKKQIFKTDDLVKIGKAPRCNLCNRHMATLNVDGKFVGFKCCYEIRFEN